MKGLFLNGYRYQNGYVVGTISTGKVANVKVKSLKGNSIKVEAPPCETWMITSYWEQCTDYYTEGGYLFETTCRYWSQSSTIEICSASPDSGGGGGGGGTTNPPSDPGPNDPCGGSSTPTYSFTPSVSVLMGNVPCEEIDNNFANICGTYSTTKVGFSYTETINGLGFTVSVNGGVPTLINFSQSCFEIPSYGINANDASNAFILGYNLALQKIMTGVHYGVIPNNPAAVKTAFTVALNLNLNAYKLGSAFAGGGPCLGNVAVSAARYCTPR